MVRQNKGERNYHVFYLLTGGSPPELQKTLKLNDEFKYLSQEADLRGSDPAKAFNEVVSAMKSIGSIIKGGMPPSRTTSETMRRTKGNSMCGAWISRMACWVPVSGTFFSWNTPA